MRRRATVGVLLLCGLVFLIWRIAFHGAHPQTIFNPPPQPLATPPALAQLGEIDVRDVPFREAVEELARRYACPIHFDEPRLVAQKIPLDAPVTLRLRGVTVHSLFKHLIRQQSSRQLTTAVRDGVLHVTTVGDWATNRAYWETQLYTPLATDVTLAKSNPPGTDFRYEWLPSDFSDPYSRASVAEVEQLGDAILISAPRETQELTGWLRGRVEQHALDGRGGYATEAIFLDGPSQPGNSRVRAALDKPIDFDLDGMPLSRFAEAVSDQLAIPVVLELPRGEPVPEERESVLHGWFPGVSLRNVLRLVLTGKQLSYYVADEALVIASNTHVQSAYVEALYPVQDLAELFREAERSSGTLFKAESWLALSVDNSLLRVGTGLGVGDVRASRRFVRVFLPEDVHAHLADALASLRQQVFPWSIRPPTDLAQVRLRESLAEEVLLEADESLIAFARRLRRDFQINVWVDPFASRRVRGVAPRGSLNHAIHALLVPLGLSTVEVSGMLAVTDSPHEPSRTGLRVLDKPRWYRIRVPRADQLDAEMLSVVLGIWCAQTAGMDQAAQGCSLVADDVLVEVRHPGLLHEHLQKLVDQLNNGYEEPIEFAPTIPGRSVPEDVQQEPLLAIYPISGALGHRLRSGSKWPKERLQAALAMGIDLHRNREELRLGSFFFSQYARNEMLRVGEHLFVDARRETHERINQRLAALNSSLSSPVSEGAVCQVVTPGWSELPEHVSEPLLYDVRPLERILSDAAWDELVHLLLDACESSETYPQLADIVVFQGYVAARGNKEAHEKLRQAFDHLVDTPPLAAALRQPNFAGVKFQTDIQPDPEIAVLLLDVLAGARDEVERRMAASLLASRATGKSPIGAPLLDVQRRAADAQDWWLVEKLCETISRVEVPESEAAELLEQFARQAPASTLKSILSALASFGYHGGDSLLRLRSTSTGWSGSTAEMHPHWFHETFREAIVRWAIHLLASSDPDNPQIDPQMELLLHRCERRQNAISVALSRSEIGIREPMNKLERELITRDIVPPRSERPF